MKCGFKKFMAMAALVVFAGAALAGCGAVAEKSGGSSSSGGAAKAKHYTIACDAKYAPFSMEVNGQYKGIDVQLLDAIAKAEGFQVEDEYDFLPHHDAPEISFEEAMQQYGGE